MVFFKKTRYLSLCAKNFLPEAPIWTKKMGVRPYFARDDPASNAKLPCEIEELPCS
jgi:hypothetical protein